MRFGIPRPKPVHTCPEPFTHEMMFTALREVCRYRRPSSRDIEPRSCRDDIVIVDAWTITTPLLHVSREAPIDEWRRTIYPDIHRILDVVDAFVRVVLDDLSQLVAAHAEPQPFDGSFVGVDWCLDV